MIAVFAPFITLTVGRTLIEPVGMQISEADSVTKAVPALVNLADEQDRWQKCSGQKGTVRWRDVSHFSHSAEGAGGLEACHNISWAHKTSEGAMRATCARPLDVIYYNVRRGGMAWHGTA